MEKRPVAKKKNTLEIIAAAVEDKPHSFQFIRKATGLKLSDEVLTALARSDQARFKLVRFRKLDSGGARIRPGFPGVALRKS
jgi:hypothetical protein